MPTPAAECGFEDADGLAGSEILAAIGPTLPVYVGFDARFGEGLAREPDLPAERLAALVDTGASNSCIDAELADRLQLPIVNQETIGGVGGVMAANVYWAQIHIPELNTSITGPFAGVHLAAGQQPHRVLIGRDFLRYFTMVYAGRTGSVKISSAAGGRGFWREWRLRFCGRR